MSLVWSLLIFIKVLRCLLTFMWVLFMRVPLTLETVLVAIAEASHHISLMNLCLILLSKCINDDDDDDDDDEKDVK